MTKFLIDFWMDGYESEAAMIEAAPDYIFDNLDSAGASVKVVCHIDEDNLLNEVERLRAEVAWLDAKVRELEDIPTCPVCGEPMTRRNADGTLGCNLCYALDGDA